MPEEPEVLESLKKEEEVSESKDTDEENKESGSPAEEAETEQHLLLRRKKRRPQKVAEDAGLPHTVQLGIHMFFTVLDVLETADNLDHSETLAVAREIIPLFHNLAPQSLSDQRVLEMADPHMSADQKSMFVLQHVKILDRLVNFFFRCAGNSLSGSVGLPHRNLHPSKAPAALLENKSSAPDAEKRDAGLPIKVPGDLRARSLEALFALACCRTGFYELLLTVLLLLTAAKQSLVHHHSRPMAKSHSEKVLPSALKPKPAIAKRRNEGSSRNNGAERNQDGGKDAEEDAEIGLEPVHVHAGLKHLASVDGKYVVETSRLEKDTEEVELWSCGQNSYGELAHGNTLAQKIPTKAKLTSGRNIVQVAAGNEHTITLTSAGHVYTVG